MKVLMNFFEPVHVLSAVTGQAWDSGGRCVYFQGYLFIWYKWAKRVTIPNKSYFYFFKQSWELNLVLDLFPQEQLLACVSLISIKITIVTYDQYNRKMKNYREIYIKRNLISWGWPLNSMSWICFLYWLKLFFIPVKVLFS